MRQRRRQSARDDRGEDAGADDADVDEHRARHVERRLRVAVEGVLDLAQGRERVADELDGGAAALLLRGVRRRADEAHVEPQQPDLRRAQMAAGRLDEHARVGVGVARQRAGKGAVAAQLLLDDAVQREPGCRPQPEAAERPHRAHHRREAALHVAGAAAVEPARPVASSASKGAAAPEIGGVGRHDVHVSAQEQRAPGRPGGVGRRLPASDDVRLALTSQSSRACSGCAPSTCAGRGRRRRPRARPSANASAISAWPGSSLPQQRRRARPASRAGPRRRPARPRRPRGSPRRPGRTRSLIGGR